MTTARKRALLGAIALIIVATVGVAIAVVTRGGGNATANSSTAAQAGQAPGRDSATFEKFRQCLQQNGVTPQPGTRPDRNDPAFAQALQACRQYAPQRAPGSGFGPPGSNQSATPS